MRVEVARGEGGKKGRREGERASTTPPLKEGKGGREGATEGEDLLGLGRPLHGPLPIGV